MIEVDGKLTTTHTLTETMREVWRFRLTANMVSNVPETFRLVERVMEYRLSTRHKWRADEKTAWYAYSAKRNRDVMKPTPPPEIIHAVRQRLAIECTNLAYEA